MNKKIIGILICVLLLSMTYSVVSAQIMIKEYEKGGNQDINVIGNSPPTDPIITCPDVVRKNWIFFVKAVSTDPDNDKIFYRIKVGNDSNPSQWIGPRDSGQGYVTGWGIFQYTGDITIGFQAKDEYGAESDWSYHTVNINKIKSKFIMPPLINILQNNPILYQLLLKFL